MTGGRACTAASAPACVRPAPSKSRSPTIPGLKPEKTRSLEGGVETGWLDGRLVADVLYFRNDYDDLIVTVSRVAGTTSYRSDNVSNARSEGVEASVSFRPVAALTVRGGLSGSAPRFSPTTAGQARRRRSRSATRCCDGRSWPGSWTRWSPPDA